LVVHPGIRPAAPFGWRPRHVAGQGRAGL